MRSGVLAPQTRVRARRVGHPLDALTVLAAAACSDDDPRGLDDEDELDAGTPFA